MVVTLRVGAELNPASSYERGFHPTAVAEHWALRQQALGCYAYHLSKRIWHWGSLAVWLQVRWHIYTMAHGLNGSILVGPVMPGLWQHAWRLQAL